MSLMALGAGITVCDEGLTSGQIVYRSRED